MKDCNYRLPCGRCDKFNISCDLSFADIEFMSKKSEENVCKHNWDKHTIVDCGKGIYQIDICSYCGEARLLRIDT